ncbi:MAG: 50S ribosomal protein L19 [Candidatus Paceibacterota bacterium]|jgi:large subunit ribosomal protein L19
MTTKAELISAANIEDRKKLDVRSGDSVRVHQKIQEKGKTRIQIFDGIVLSVKHGKEAGSTFTVRKVASGVGVEKIYPLYSPLIDKIEIVKRSKVRRAKLYHIREKAAKEISRQMRREISSEKQKDEAEKQKAEAVEAKAEVKADETK